MADLPVVLRITSQNDGSASRNLGQLEQGTLRIKTASAKAAAALRKTEREANKAARRRAKAFRDTARAAERAAKAEAAAIKQAAQEAAKAARAAEQARDRLTNLGTTVATSFTIAGGVLGALGVTIVNTARDFEALEATLRTVQGTSIEAAKTFAEAQEKATTTPFDVKGVVSANVQLEVYKQNAEKTFPRVAALAAGMGRSLKETSLVTAKALSGSAEGFESLRNTYGITTRELVKFGAEANKTGGLLLRTESQIDKAKNALLRIIDIRFGDALANRAGTVDAALSNASDSAVNFAGDIGKAIGPVVKLGASFVGKGFDALRKLPDSLKFAAGASILLGTGVGIVAGSAGLAFAGLVALDAQLQKVAASNAAAAASSRVTAGAISLMGSAASKTVAAMRLLVTTPLGLFFTGAALAGGAAYTAIKRFEQGQIDLGRQVKETSQLLTTQTDTARKLVGVVRELGGPTAEAALGQRTLTDRVAGLRTELAKLPADKVAARLKQMGIGAEEAKKALADNEKRASGLRKEYRTLLERLRELEADPFKGAADLAAISQTERAIKNLQNQLRTLAGTGQVFEIFVASFDKTKTAVEEITKGTTRTKDFLKFSDSAGDVRSLNAALDELGNRIDSNAVKLKALNQPVDREGILEKLRQGVDDPSIKIALENQLELLGDYDKRSTQIAKKQSDTEKARIAEIEVSLEREKALRTVSFQEELKSLQQRLSIARSLGKEGVQQEISILNEISALRRDHEKKNLDELRKNFIDQSAASQNFIRELRAQGAPQPEIAAAYDRAIKKVEQWRDSHKGVIAKNRELGAQIRQTLAGFKTGKAQSETKQLAENLKQLKDDVRDLGADATTSSQQLAAVERSITLVKQAQRAGSVDTKAADELLEDLARRRLGLEQTITQEKLRQAGQTQQLEIEGLRQEIDLLELKKQAGLDVDNALLAKRQELHEARLTALDLERQAERETADDKAAVDEKFNLKARNLDRQRTLEFQRETTKRAAAAKKASEDASKPSSSTGGQQSTRGGFSLGTGFSLPTFSLDDSSSRDARKARIAAKEAQRKLAFEQGNPQAVARIRELDANRARSIARNSADPRLSKPFGSEKAAGLASRADAIAKNGRAPKPSSKAQVTNNFRTTVNLDISDGDPDVQQITKASQRIARKQRRRKRLNGQTSPNSPIGFGR